MIQLHIQYASCSNALLYIYMSSATHGYYYLLLSDSKAICRAEEQRVSGKYVHP